ncbi:MAG: small, acid-soluble spore protein, alpha/beta type [Firmicutes bacterium]|nr:small, acid-soluble spore protein, alpha/beta type [Bacillota bacterium]
MARRRSVMSEAMKYEMAKDMGVADIVEREGWGGVTSRQCGNMVRLAIEKAEQMLRDNNIDNS